jgi:hypothetical protein
LFEGALMLAIRSGAVELFFRAFFSFEQAGIRLPGTPYLSIDRHHRVIAHKASG